MQLLGRHCDNYDLENYLKMKERFTREGFAFVVGGSPGSTGYLSPPVDVDAGGRANLC